MNRPLATFRHRRRPIRRLLFEALGGSFIAFLVSGIPYLYGSEAWSVLGGFVAIIGAAAVYLRHQHRKEKETITLYEDRIVWRDHRGRRQEAEYSRIIDVEPDQRRHKHWVRVHGTDGFWISPEIERFTELWRRLYHPMEVRGAMPFGQETWTARNTYRHGQIVTRRAVFFLVVGMFLFSITSARHLIGGYPLALGVLILGIQQLMTSIFERIEFVGGEIVHRSWIPGVKRSIPLGRIVGACLYESRFGYSGVIDTDFGEIRFGDDFEGVEGMVTEAERLGTARYARTKPLALEAPTEQSSTA